MKVRRHHVDSPAESVKPSVVDNHSSAIDCTQPAMSGEITVTDLGVKGNQLRVGIDAPDDITILREEMVADAESA
jgi:hypothetical protein